MKSKNSVPKETVHTEFLDNLTADRTVSYDMKGTRQMAQEIGRTVWFCRLHDGKPIPK